MITNSGLKVTMDLLISGTTHYVTHMGFGSGLTSPAFTDNNLVWPTYRGSSFIGNLGSPIVGNTYYMLTNSVQSYEMKTTSETGFFTSGTTGSLYNRAIFTAFNMDNGSDWLFEWDLAYRDGNV